MKFYKDTPEDIKEYAENGISHPCNSCYDCLDGSGCDGINKNRVNEYLTIDEMIYEYLRNKKEREGDG